MKFLKTLFVMAALCFSSAQAADHEVWVTKNELGGTIILTGAECPVAEMKGSKISMIAQAPDTVVYGCWFVLENVIFVAWFYQGQVHKGQYDPAIFVKERVL
jgi:opacity protein-like surface antigen